MSGPHRHVTGKEPVSTIRLFSPTHLLLPGNFLAALLPLSSKFECVCIPFKFVKKLDDSFVVGRVESLTPVIECTVN